MLRRPSPPTALACTALVVATTGAAVAAIPNSKGEITACYAKRGGDVRIVDEGKRCKRKTERRLTWNQAGTQGERGPAGAGGGAGGAGGGRTEGGGNGRGRGG